MNEIENQLAIMLRGRQHTDIPEMQTKTDKSKGGRKAFADQVRA